MSQTQGDRWGLLVLTDPCTDVACFDSHFHTSEHLFCTPLKKGSALVQSEMNGTHPEINAKLYNIAILDGIRRTFYIWRGKSDVIEKSA